MVVAHIKAIASLASMPEKITSNTRKNSSPAPNRLTLHLSAKSPDAATPPKTTPTAFDKPTTTTQWHAIYLLT